MNTDTVVLLAIAALALLSYALRASGFVLASYVHPESFSGRLLQRAPGNLFIAFVVAGIATGGVPVLVGAGAGLVAAIVFRHEIAVLSAGAAGVALTSLLF